jgi:hypothetical protein
VIPRSVNPSRTEGESKKALGDRAEQLVTERHELRHRDAKAIVVAKVDAVAGLQSFGAKIGKGMQAACESFEGAASGTKEKAPAEE